MFKMNFGQLSPSTQTQRSSIGSNYSFASSGNRQLPSLLLNISNTGKGCGGCGKK